MAEYIVRWNIGFGDNYEVIEADTEEDANKIAYECWREDVENNADYDVVGEATDELKEEHDI